MRCRSDLEKMRRRADPHRWSLKPGSDPIVWVVPDWVEYDTAEWDELLREKVKEIGEYWLAPGHDLALLLVGDWGALMEHKTAATIEFSAVRRDTNSLREARWQSRTPERTPQ